MVVDNNMNKTEIKNHKFEVNQFLFFFQNINFLEIFH